ncbi:MAG: DUF3006 domain-containing protein [Methanoregula sp.]|jgi:hypothetical protein|uniref:DUF3006 domain-containing protein n=1 Tax=Methanoregula sp. TaxID=2052170 RepID=UPI0025D2D341|nr:DUF3006 domain-containing protein [Methanoregula sp.]MCK9630828.1 DUF3006 domain-containing protein [Methanoregula sp.]
MRATVDQIDEGIAVMVPREGDARPFHLPVSFLPPGCREGDIVTVTIVRDDAATAEAKERVAGFIQRLEQKGR